MNVQNPYFEVMLAIETSPQKTDLSDVLFYVVLSNCTPMQAFSFFSTR
jgi:hypothetical protein